MSMRTQYARNTRTAFEGLLEMAHFKVEAILKTLDELQKEKNKIDQILAKECAKRKKLELETENLKSTLAQAADWNTKLKSEVKLQEQKKEQTQIQMDRFEEVNENIRRGISQLNKKINENEDKRHCEQEAFEQKLGQLIEKFRSGWQNMEGCTQDELSLYDKERVEQQEMLEKNKAELEHLTAQLELAQTSQSRLAQQIPDKLWEDVCKMFEGENRASLESLERKKKESHLDKLEDELSALTETRHNNSS